MKFFGLTILREDPLETEYKRYQEELERNALVRACLGKSCFALIDCDVYFNPVKEHRKLYNKKECHYFMGKKYCYHKGKQIITKE